MHPARRRLLWINVLGGIAVLGSYVHGVATHADAGAVWGGVPEALQPIYTVNMLLAATGYFLFSPFVFFKLPPDTTRVAGRFGYDVFSVLYLLILVPSALWMPLTFEMLESPGPLLWASIRLDLALVGVGSVGLLAAILATPAPHAPRARVAAAIGCLPFCLQTAVLDALVWPAYFPA